MDDVLTQLERSLDSLKDFQRATVDRVVENFAQDGHSQRVLVADEVGLGKTIVAKGVIAKLLMTWLTEHVTATRNRPMRVTYICSNLTLANENRQKLAVFDRESRTRYVQEPSFGRLVELVVRQQATDTDKVLEICSLTPSTSFTLTQSDGNVKERYILYRCLLTDNRLARYGTVLRTLFQNGVMDQTWNNECKWFEDHRFLDQNIVEDFLRRLEGKATLPTDLADWLQVAEPSWIDVLEAIGQKGSVEEAPSKYRLRCHLRVELARACARHLTADLFILDEFQRFNTLLDTNADTEDALIAHEVFSRDNRCKILLLSATPFKAMTRIEDDECESAHHEELRHLLSFLTSRDQEKLDEYEQARKALLNVILSLRDDSFDTERLDSSAKERVERALMPYICRTERSQIGDNFDAVYDQRAYECLDTFDHKDITSYQAMSTLAAALDRHHNSGHGHQLMEFYKSAPWPLSFLNGYAFKNRLEDLLDTPDIRQALKRSREGWLSKSQLQSYRIDIGKDAPNAKLRSLVDVVFSDKSEELLWVPPSAPHYPLEGCFKDNSTFTKTLLFSSWAMVPRALSGLLSYEAERRLLSRGKRKKRYFQGKNEKVRPLIRFEGKATLTGWSLVYPSQSLINIGLAHGTETLPSLISERQKLFMTELGKLKKYTEGENSRTRWYAVASLLLDVENGHDEWLDEWFAGELANAGDSGREGHLRKLEESVEEARNNTLQLGPMPEDLAEYLALLSLAAPGVCSARVFDYLWDAEPSDQVYFATRVGMSIVQMFNKPESAIAIQKGIKGNEHWHHILRYCVNGGLQAMLDEYGHLLKGAGLTITQAEERLSRVTGFRTTTVACQFEENKYQPTSRDSKSGSSLRCHYAVPLGNQKATDQGQLRVEHIRDAFNSPFKPFVLNSTSIGQEGLDFHWYCSRVVHWNLPSNPIDIEQREGRVNRYKSLVVRRRVAETVTNQAPLVNGVKADYWQRMFEQANRLTKNLTSDLTPYWHMPTGNACIERVIPMMPMSREVGKLEEVLKILSLYRLAFGQPRQEELLKNLLNRSFNQEKIEKIKQDLVLTLSPLLKTNKILKQSKSHKPVFSQNADTDI